MGDIITEQSSGGNSTDALLGSTRGEKEEDQSTHREPQKINITCHLIFQKHYGNRKIHNMNPNPNPTNDI